MARKSWRQTEEKKLSGTTNVAGVEKLKMAKAFMECVGDEPGDSVGSDSAAPVLKNISQEEEALKIVLADYRTSLHQEANQGLLSKIFGCTRVPMGDPSDILRCTHPLTLIQIVSIASGIITPAWRPRSHHSARCTSTCNSKRLRIRITSSSWPTSRECSQR